MCADRWVLGRWSRLVPILGHVALGGMDRWLPGLGQLVSWIMASAGRHNTLGGLWGVGRRNTVHEACSLQAP